VSTSRTGATTWAIVYHACLRDAELYLLCCREVTSECWTRSGSKLVALRHIYRLLETTALIYRAYLPGLLAMPHNVDGLWTQRCSSRLHGSLAWVQSDKDIWCGKLRIDGHILR